MSASKAPKNSQAFLPDADQELLLKAALLEGEEAVVSWKERLKRIAFDDTDYACSRLLPLVYRNFSEQGYDDAYMGRMRGIYRLTWAENKKNFQLIGPAFQALEAAGIPTLLLKGGALIVMCYKDFGLRGMGDLDLVVPEARVEDAMAVLQKIGWRAAQDFGKLKKNLHHAVHLTAGSREDLDLHWHILANRCAEEFDRPFWSASHEVEEGAVRFSTVPPSEHLFHACVHGAAWSPSSPVRWVADAFYLIRRCEIDWNRILVLAEILGMIPVLQSTLPYLEERFAAGVPSAFLAQLDSLESPAWQRRELEALCRPHGFFGILPMLWNRHRGLRAGSMGVGNLWNFPAYLRDFYGWESYRGLGRMLARKAFRKLSGRPAPEPPPAMNPQ